MIKRRNIKPSSYTLEQAEKLKPAKKAQEEQSPLAVQVMRLGESCGYREIEVNSALVIGAGVWYWRAYADKAVARRLKEIERAIGLKLAKEAMENAS